MRTKKILALLLASVICLSMAACNKPAEKKEEGKSKPEQGAVVPTRDENQFFNAALGNEPSTLDVSRRSDSYSLTILTNTLEGLVRKSEKDGEYVTIPGEAETWENSPDGKVWTFHLRENLKWQDGEPVTAQQYVYSLQRSADPATGCPNSFFLAPLKNYKEVSEGTKPVTELGAVALDERTLQLTLDNPRASFLDMLPTTIYYPQRQDWVEKHGEKYGSEVETYIGNGPFLMESWVHTSKIVLKKNPNYWNAENIQLETVTLNIMNDETTRYAAFDSESLDVISSSQKDYVDKYTKANKTANEMLLGDIAFAVYNMKDPMFSNLNMRKAFTMAVDREEYNQMVSDGLRKPLYGWVSPAFTVGEKNYVEEAGEPLKNMQEQMKKDGKTAKDYLLEGMKELNLGDDPSKLKVDLSLSGTSPAVRAQGEYLQQTFKEQLGVEVTLNNSDWGIFNSNITKGNFQIAAFGLAPYYNDPYDLLGIFTPGHGVVKTGFESQEYNDIMDLSVKEMDTDKRIAYYQQAEKMLVEEQCVVCPFQVYVTRAFYQPWVKGFSKLPFTSTGYMNYYTEGRK